MKNSFFIIFFSFSFHLAYSQIGIGTITPSQSTILDIYASNKGVLLPRVALQGKNDISTIANGNQQGLLVYNTNTVADVSPGFYYWDNVEWQRLSILNTNYTGSTSIALNGDSFERAALTGDVTATANSNTTIIANNAVNSEKISDGTVANVDLTNMAALSVKGNATNAPAVPTDIAAANDGDVLRRSGTTLGFGTIGNTSLSTGVGGIYKGSGSLSGATTVTQGTNSLAFASSTATGTAISIQPTALTTGTGLLINLGGALLAAPGTGLTISSTVGNTTGRLLNISYTGANLSAAGRLLNISGDNIGPTSGTGILANISANAIVSNTAFSVSSTGSGLTTGRLMRITGNSQTSGTLATFSGSALTSGTALEVSTGSALTATGKALSVTTGNITAGSGLEITTGTLGTAGKALSISSNNNAVNTEGVIKVVNTAASGTGIFATFNANSAAGSGLTILNNGNAGIGTNSPTALLDVNGDTIRLRNAKTPTSSTSPGNIGDIAWDSDYVYVCVAPDTWKRSALSSW